MWDNRQSMEKRRPCFHNTVLHMKSNCSRKCSVWAATKHARKNEGWDSEETVMGFETTGTTLPPCQTHVVPSHQENAQCLGQL